ncbi:hypothetical protein P8C59_000334 [Phyllachora maydis]|uniref:DUF7605 domain-containing protein n=1 Tax=Phyllachora maydis TaxID=1825666 RepID=A0AAD9M8N8_9PEZI|nr:hypothetical protein P8C59_000334 [Phyllachora maydis]
MATLALTRLGVLASRNCTPKFARRSGHSVHISLPLLHPENSVAETHSLLDNDVVPTNCMRACTAVVTEISYNEATDPEKQYRAEVEFISNEAWTCELEILLQDLLSEGHLSHEYKNRESEAGVAWAKIQAVYPWMTKEALLEYKSAKELAGDDTVRHHLGSVKEIEAHNSAEFSKKLQKYVDSKDKGPSRDMRATQSPRSETAEHWPLIKAVRIFCKSRVLESGITLVDLPGVADSNAARAVDDKAAQDIMGASFNRQLQLDGNLSNVTFICSKTDDILITEAIKNLGAQAAEADDVNTQIKAMGEQAKEKELDASTKLETLQVSKKESKAEEKKTSKEVKKLRKEVAIIKADIKAKKSSLLQMCISSRNSYSRPAIQAQFARGLKLLDHEMAERENAELFDPSRDLRNYDEVADQLSVFCVSARAYLKMSGKLEKDDHLPGFTDVQQSEIPQLQAHAIRLTTSTRLTTCRRFFTAVEQLLNSLMLQVIVDDRSTVPEVKRQEFAYLELALEALTKELIGLVKDSMNECRILVEHSLLRKLPDAARLASAKAISTVRSWSLAKADGGLAYQTFKAICIRKGQFKGLAGFKDFNGELVQPMKNRLGSRWERTFKGSLPAKIDLLGQYLSERLGVFHAKMTSRQHQSQSSTAALMDRQINSFQESLRDMSGLKSIVKQSGKEINEQFDLPIAEGMTPAYVWATAQSGTGVYERLRHFMLAHIEEHGAAMFDAAEKTVVKGLTSMLDVLDGEVHAKIQEVLEQVERDYTALIASRNLFEALAKARDEIRFLLATADERFATILRKDAPVSPAGLATEPGPAMKTEDADVDGCAVPPVGQDSSPGIRRDFLALVLD